MALASPLTYSSCYGDDDHGYDCECINDHDCDDVFVDGDDDTDCGFSQTGGGSCYTVNQEKCIFPFQYKGQRFTQCTTVGLKCY